MIRVGKDDLNIDSVLQVQADKYTVFKLTCAETIVISPQTLNIHLHIYIIIDSLRNNRTSSYSPLCFACPGYSLISCWLSHWWPMSFNLLLSVSRFKYVHITMNRTRCSMLKGIGLAEWRMSIFSAVHYSMCPKDRQLAWGLSIEPIQPYSYGS